MSRSHVNTKIDILTLTDVMENHYFERYSHSWWKCLASIVGGRIVRPKDHVTAELDLQRQFAKSLNASQLLTTNTKPVTIFDPYSGKTKPTSS